MPDLNTRIALALQKGTLSVSEYQFPTGTPYAVIRDGDTVLHLGGSLSDAEALVSTMRDRLERCRSQSRVHG